MYKNRKVAAIISAGGSGKRMGAPVPKQFLMIGGKTILEASVDKFCGEGCVDEVIVVVPEEYEEFCCGLFGAGRYKASGIKVITGGSERQESVGKAIDALAHLGAEDIVLIHVIITLVKLDDEVQTKVAEEIYTKLNEEGIEVVLDDRKERPGVKFKDADLLGIPIRITVGKLAGEGKVEYKMRRDHDKEEIGIEEALARAIDTVRKEIKG